MPTPRYYPVITDIFSLDFIPDDSPLKFFKDALTNVLGKIHYKDYQYAKTPHGDGAFHSLSIVSAARLEMEIPAKEIILFSKLFIP